MADQDTADRRPRIADADPLTALSRPAWLWRMGCVAYCVDPHRMAYSYVLVVDDDPAIRGLVADALRGEGYVVDLAAHGREALDAMRANRPATVILDLMMPVMDGFSFLEACHAEHLCPDVPIVVISAVQDLLRRVHEMPVNACIAKPFDLDDLIRTVGHYARPNGRAV